MKNYQKKARTFLAGGMLILGFWGLPACNSGETSGETVSTVGNPASETVFYDAVLQVTPSFEQQSNSSLSPLASLVTTWESGNPLYEVFYLFQDFDPDTDQGVIDTSNLYKTMWEARNFESNTRTQCATITEQAITPPFDFGNPPTTYTCAFNQEASNGYDFGGATRQSGTTRYGLFGFVWPGSHNEYGSLQGSYDSGTSILAIDMAIWVDYTDQNDYCYRNDIDGNSTTHEFTLRSVKGNRVAGSSFISIVGKGFSQGTGKYFLLKITSNDLSTAKYYCLGAEEGETELRAMSAAGSDSVDPNCATYQEAVDALTPLTTADLACESADFNPGGTGTAAEGTIFLDFE